MGKHIDRRATSINIANKMQKAEISIKELAYSIDCSAQAVWKYTHSKALPTIEHLLQISQILGCSVEELIILEE